jgi:hypothetical protein
MNAPEDRLGFKIGHCGDVRCTAIMMDEIMGDAQPAGNIWRQAEDGGYFLTSPVET